MSPVQRVFSIFDADHLTRIHLLLALQDLGFDVTETGLFLSLTASETHLISSIFGPEGLHLRA